jgi:hypothetical protein
VYTLKKSIKVSNNTTVNVNQSKPKRSIEHNRCAWIEEYIDCFDGRLSPVPEKFLDRLAQELVEHAEKSPILRLEWFFVKKKMSPYSGRKWAERYDLFGKAYKEAQFILGMRREHLALHRDITEGITIKSLYKFDPMYAEIRQDDIDAKIAISKAIAEAEADKHYVYERRDVPSLQYDEQPALPYDEPKMIEGSDDTVVE